MPSRQARVCNACSRRKSAGSAHPRRRDAGPESRLAVKGSLGMASLDSELNDIQGIILRAYGRLPFACYIFLKIDDPIKAKTWLRELVDAGEITTALYREKREERLTPHLNIAVSATGLRALGL